MNADAFWDIIQNKQHPPVVLPDIGTFFNQDLDIAQKLFDDVSTSGIQFIKGEILHNADICLPGEQIEQYLDSNGNTIQENYRELIERKVVTLDQYESLFRPCKSLNLGLVLSVYDFAGTDFAVQIQASALKIASTNIVHAPLIRYCAATKLPLILDSGKATRQELTRAINWAKDAGCERLIIEYSPPAPPASIDKHNLNVLPSLETEFQLPTGLSDHHSGEEMLYAATVLGCRVLEKGVCPDQQASDQDVYHALPVGQLKQVIKRCNNIHAALGNATNAYQAPPSRPAARMGIISKTDLKPGEIITSDNVNFAFPTLGVEVENWDKVKGKAVHKAVAKNQPIGWTDVIT